MIAYFDASALVKMCVSEDHSAAARVAWDAADEALTVRIAYAEARAAFAAARRDRRLTKAGHAQARRTLDGLFNSLGLIEAGEIIVRQAGDLADRRGLRGYDAVHLSAALAGSGGSADVLLVTWDADLASAARAEGLQTAGAP